MKHFNSFFTEKKMCAVLFFCSFTLFSFAAGEKIYVNEINGNEKWLEIYNSENVEVNLTGYVIQKIDELGFTFNWPIPAGTRISAKGFLVWTQDDNCLDGSTFTWGISAKKDVAFKIFDNKGVALDYFEVRMAAGLNSLGGRQSVGRATDGAANLVIFEIGSKGASNGKPVIAGAKIYINEISGNEKWLEIYNDETTAINLSGYIIRKDAKLADDWIIPNGTIIQAKGYLVWTQDSTCTNGSTFTWGISSKKDVNFRILNTNNDVLDVFEVFVDKGLYSDGEEKTVGRITDGAATLIVFKTGSKGGSNSLGVPSSTRKTFLDEYNIYIENNVLHLPEGASNIHIYDITGKLISSGEKPIYLSKGTYVVKLKIEGKAIIKKMMF